MTQSFLRKSLSKHPQSFYLEVLFLILLWGVYFICINVNWTGSWIEKSFLSKSIAPHYALAYPLIFFVNVYWLIPKYLNRSNWLWYIIISLGLLLTFELLRSGIFAIALPTSNFKIEFLGDNSLIFSRINVLTFNAVFFSFFYRFCRDWFVNSSRITDLEVQNEELIKKSNSSINIVENSFATAFNTKKRNEKYVLHVEDIVYFKAQGDFVLAVDSNDRRHNINESLKRIIDKLDPRLFFQINRGEVINFRYFESFKPYIKNRLEIKLRNTEITFYTTNSRTPEFRKWTKR